MNRKLVEIAAREQTLAQRERQIAEQRHILSEEDRLLRQRQAERLASVPRATMGFHGRSEGASHGSFWQRIFRFFAREAPIRS